MTSNTFRWIGLTVYVIVHDTPNGKNRYMNVWIKKWKNNRLATTNIFINFLQNISLFLRFHSFSLCLHSIFDFILFLLHQNDLDTIFFSFAFWIQSLFRVYYFRSSKKTQFFPHLKINKKNYFFSPVFFLD